VDAHGLSTQRFAGKARTVIEWTDGMSVGVEALDDDHRRLIDLLNRIDAIVQGEAPQDGLIDIVHELVRYTEYHFESEERLMRLNRYPDLDAHERMHRDLRRRIVSFEQKFRSAPDQHNASALLAFLSDWLAGHILGEDMKYRPYVARESA
jgi:hemerythrin